MKLYRVEFRADGGVSYGYEFCSSKVEAKRVAKKFVADHSDIDESAEAEIRIIEVEISKKGVLLALNRYASHEQNG